jgi:putative membrane protein
VQAFLKDYGFRLDRNERGFRRRRGLFTKTDVVMAVNRVQAVTITTGPIRKRRGWHALKFISLAQDSKAEKDFVAAPFAQLSELYPIMHETGIQALAEDASFRKARFVWWLSGLLPVTLITILALSGMVLFGDILFGRASLILCVPVLFLGIRLLEWRSYGYYVDTEQLYVRQYWLNQRTIIVPQINVQSLEITQGPISRIIGLSRLHLGIAGGRMTLYALPLNDAFAIRAQVMAAIAPVDFSVIPQMD